MLRRGLIRRSLPRRSLVAQHLLVPHGVEEGEEAIVRADIAPALLTSGGDGAPSTTEATASVTPTANAWQCIVVVGTGTAVAAPSGITSGGLTWEKVTDITGGSGTTATNTSMWRAQGAAPTAGAATITWTDAPAANATWAWAEFVGADVTGSNGAGAVVQSDTDARASAANLSLGALNAFEHANNLCVAVMGSNTDTHADDADFTPLAHVTGTSPTTGLRLAYALAQLTYVSTGATGACSGIAIELKAGIA